MTVLDWLLDSDPAIRWQVLRDLVDAPAESSRRSARGWPPRAGAPGCWRCRAKTASGREARSSPRGGLNSGDGDQTKGQPWTATANTRRCCMISGSTPTRDRVRRAVALVRDHCRWEHAGQPFFSGEVEPCINGRTVTLGIYFDQDVERHGRPPAG